MRLWRFLAHITDAVPTEQDEDVFFSLPIQKMEMQSDGSIVVEGLCTNDNIDLDDQIIDLAFSRKGLGQWAETYANVRQMHSTNLPPAGKGISVDTTRPDGVWLKARIIEPTAVKLCKEGVYNSFSVGISRPVIIKDRLAKNGRVVGGVFSEVSVVDFPANPIARFNVTKNSFNIAKRSKQEIDEVASLFVPIGTIMKGTTPVSIDNIEKSTTPCAVCGGLGKVGADNCGLCGGAGIVGGIGKSESSNDKCATCKGTGKVGDSDCADCTSIAEPEVTKGEIPDEDKEVTEDLEEADEDIQAARAAQEEDNEGHESENDDDDDEDDDVNKVAFAVRRAHDVLCEAFSHEDVEKAYPVVAANGIKSVISPDLIRTVLIAKGDNMTNEQFSAVASGVGAATILATAQDEDIMAARDEMHKLFSDAYPTTKAVPGSVTPGQFDRSYLSTGRAPLHSDGSNPRIPVSNSEVNAEEFDRGPLTTDHQDTPPGNVGLPTASTMSAAEQITAISRDSAAGAMINLHDHISSAYPNICPLATNGAISAGLSGAGAERIDTNGRMTPISASATPQLTKAEKERALRAEKIEKARKELKQLEAEEAEAVAAVESSVVKGAVSSNGEVSINAAELDTIIAKAVEAATSPLLEKLKSVEADMEKMASEPDPAQAPMRGSVMVSTRHEVQPPSVVEKLHRTAEDEMQEQLEYLNHMQKSGNSELRLRAEAAREALLEKFATVLTSN